MAVEPLGETLISGSPAAVRFHAERYYYDSHNQLRQHLADFVSAYNFARRLKTLKGLTPYEFICKTWLKEPKRFKFDPVQQMPGPNIVL